MTLLHYLFQNRSCLVEVTCQHFVKVIESELDISCFLFLFKTRKIGNYVRSKKCIPEFQRSLFEKSAPEDQRQFLAVFIRCGASAKK